MTRAFLILASALVISAGTLTAQAPRVTGSVTYRERIALPATAVVEVSLEDVSRADAPAIVVANARINHPGQVPIAFDLPYNPGRIEATHRYAVRARILEGERVAFASSGADLVVTQGHGRQASLVLTSVAGTEPSASSSLRPVEPSNPRTLEPSTPRAVLLAPAVPLTNLPATFTGTLPCVDCPGIRYQLNLFPDDSFFVRTTAVGKLGATTADEIGSWVLSSDRRVLVLKGHGLPQFFSIRDGLTLRKLDSEADEIALPAQMSLRRSPDFQPIDARMTFRGSYRDVAGTRQFTECSTGQRWLVAAAADLDTAYRGAAKKPGDAVMLEVDGHLVADRGASSALVVDRVTHASAAETCAVRFVGAPLENTSWRLTRLDGAAVAASTGGSGDPALIFRAESGSFSGSAGCNRLAGNYTVSGEAISFVAAGTLKACAAGTDADAAFRSALSQATRFRIVGSVLDLYGADNHELARFQARP